MWKHLFGVFVLARKSIVFAAFNGIWIYAQSSGSHMFYGYLWNVCALSSKYRLLYTCWLRMSVQFAFSFYFNWFFVQNFHCLKCSNTMHSAYSECDRTCLIIPLEKSGNCVRFEKCCSHLGVISGVHKFEWMCVCVCVIEHSRIYTLGHKPKHKLKLTADISSILLKLCNFYSKPNGK